jgi:hypothetical protein
MDFSKLDQNEKLATYGSVAVVIAGLVSSWGGLLFLSILAAIGMLVVVFLPQFSPSTTLPGSKGTLMATLGIVAAAGALITTLQWFTLLGALLSSFSTVLFLVTVIGALVMAWAGWQELQSEGGKWVFGASTASRADAPAAPPPAAAAPSEPPAATTVETAPPPPETDAAADAPYRRDDEDRPAG